MLPDLDNGEVWKNPRVLNGKYEVSDRGRVRHVFSGKIYAQYTTSRGYLVLRHYLPRNGGPQRTKHWLKVHRLVAIAFWPNFDRSLQVDHINGDKADNRLENLRPATNAENQANHGSRVCGNTPYRGVTWRKDGYYLCTARSGKKNRTKRKRTLLGAILERDILAANLHGEFAYVHFPMPFRSDGDWMVCSPPENPTVTSVEL